MADERPLKVAVIASEESGDLLGADLARALERQTGRAVLCYCHDTEPTSFMEGLEFFAGHRVDAVVMDGNEELRQRLAPYIAEGMLVVLYDNDLPDFPADRVFVDYVLIIQPRAGKGAEE